MPSGDIDDSVDVGCQIYRAFHMSCSVPAPDQRKYGDLPAYQLWMIMVRSWSLWNRSLCRSLRCIVKLACTIKLSSMPCGDISYQPMWGVSCRVYLHHHGIHSLRRVWVGVYLCNLLEPILGTSCPETRPLLGAGRVCGRQLRRIRNFHFFRGRGSRAGCPLELETLYTTEMAGTRSRGFRLSRSPSLVAGGAGIRRGGYAVHVSPMDET